MRDPLISPPHSIIKQSHPFWLGWFPLRQPGQLSQLVFLLLQAAGFDPTSLRDTLFFHPARYWVTRIGHIAYQRLLAFTLPRRSPEEVNPLWWSIEQHVREHRAARAADANIGRPWQERAQWALDELRKEQDWAATSGGPEHLVSLLLRAARDARVLLAPSFPSEEERTARMLAAFHTAEVNLASFHQQLRYGHILRREGLPPLVVTRVYAVAEAWLVAQPHRPLSQLVGRWVRHSTRSSGSISRRHLHCLRATEALYLLPGTQPYARLLSCLARVIRDAHTFLRSPRTPAPLWATDDPRPHFSGRDQGLPEQFQGHIAPRDIIRPETFDIFTPSSGVSFSWTAPSTGPLPGHDLRLDRPYVATRSSPAPNADWEAADAAGQHANNLTYLCGVLRESSEEPFQLTALAHAARERFQELARRCTPAYHPLSGTGDLLLPPLRPYVPFFPSSRSGHFPRPRSNS